ncbi:MAG: hypothetical protein AAGL24_01485 [Pseudomonadota bacterium]
MPKREDAKGTIRAKLLDLDLDIPGAALPFADRLAHENGWSRAHTDRVIDEYRRFLVLTVEADHAITPSDAVDQAWHLHLTYTRDYWDRLCGTLIGRPLHHGPTRGGADENRHFRTLYRQTLATYERLFGEAPPDDIWPETEVRFSGRYERIDRNAYWTIPKPTRLFSALRSRVGLGFATLLFSTLGLAGLASATESLTADLTIWGLPWWVLSFVFAGVLVLALSDKSGGSGGCAAGCGGGCGD